MMMMMMMMTYLSAPNIKPIVANLHPVSGTWPLLHRSVSVLSACLSAYYIIMYTVYNRLFACLLQDGRRRSWSAERVLDLSLIHI